MARAKANGVACPLWTELACRGGIGESTFVRTGTDRVDRLHFLIYRPLQFVPLLIGITLVTFALIHVTPGDTAHLLAGNQTAPDIADQVRAQYGLDHPLVLQYVYFLGNLLQGELGRSTVYQAPVFAVVFERIWPTLFLIVYGAMLSMTLAIGLALLAARHEDGTIDRLIRGYATTGLGGLIVGSIFARDYLVVQAIALLMAVGIILARFLFDIATAAIDPRAGQ